MATWRRALPFTYRNGLNFFSVRHEDYALEVDPLFYLSYGQARQSEVEGREASVSFWQNTRGVRAAGHLGRYLFFETRLEENQRRVLRPAYRDRTAPRLGFAKFDAGGPTYDYFVATGLLGVRTKYVELRFGRDRNRWGPALGSLSLSNFATVYDQLQIRTAFWRLHYTNLFTAFTDRVPRPVSPTRPAYNPRKYGAFHQLTVRLPGRVEVGLFESVVYFSPDSLGFREKGFEVSYLNPIIFYRAVENDIVDPNNNPDNVLLGAHAAWTALPGLRLYGELLLDELDTSQLGEQWWGNKWGTLVGAHAVVPRLWNLEARAEYARLRPYLYTHQSSLTAYAHYNDVLGHPAGPNAEDVALRLALRPTHRVQGALTLARTRRGRGTEGENVGSDPLQPFSTRAADFGVVIGQGVEQTVWLAEGHAGYEFLPGAYAEVALRFESIEDEERGLDRYVAPFLLLRWGLPFQSARY